MAQTTVRKGFFFYFGLFILLLFAGFMICLVTMMFNPGKTVLWMKYFTDNKEYTVEKTSSNENIDYSSLKEIVVKCDFADVVVQCNKEYTKTGIIIYNNAKCFGTKKSKDFSYNVTKAGDVLTVEVQEPEGFLYFSKNIKVIINSATDWHFNSDLKLTVNATGNSDIFLGGGSLKNEKPIKLKTADLKTEKGKIIFRNTCDTQALEGGLTAESVSGEIKLEGLTVLGVPNDVTLKTTSGRIDISNVVLPSEKVLNIENEKGAVSFSSVTAKKININCRQGNFYFKTVHADISFGEAIDKIISPNVVVGDLDGSFVLSGTEANISPEILISKITGTLAVNGDKGKVTVYEARGDIQIESGNSLSVDVKLAASVTREVSIITKKGTVNLGFVGAYGSTGTKAHVNVVNGTGKTNISYTAALKANFISKRSDGSDMTTSYANDNITPPINTISDRRDFVTDENIATISTVKSDGKIVYKRVASV